VGLPRAHHSMQAWAGDQFQRLVALTHCRARRTCRVIPTEVTIRSPLPGRLRDPVRVGEAVLLFHPMTPTLLSHLLSFISQ
jgi:hypothetical protein